MNDKDKQIDILRSEASRIGYHGLPLDTFMKKAGGDIVLSLKTKIDDINAKGNATNKEYKLLEKSKIKLKKKIASLNVRWHDIGSLFAMVFSFAGLSFLWQNLIWGGLIYQQWIGFGLVIACATMGALIKEYAEDVSNEDKDTLIITLKIIAVMLTFVFSLDSLQYTAVVRSFILSCLVGIVVHSVNILFIPIIKGFVKIVRYCYLSMRKWSLNTRIRKSRKELYQLEHEIDTVAKNNEIFLETIISQLRLDYLLGKSASMPEGITDKIVNDNLTSEVAHA